MKCVCFGDSFVNIFLSLSSKNFTIKKFKGSTIQGLVSKNENYNSIVNFLKNDTYDYGFFVFGNVDLNFYFYYKKYIQHIDDNKVNEIIYNNAEEYVKFVYSLKNIKKKYIINVFPSTISTSHFYNALQIYGIIPKDDLIKISLEDLLIYNRNTRIDKFNSLLNINCNKKNINFCNVYKFMTTPINKSLYIIFKLQNPNNIHINFEYVLILLLNTCLSFLPEKLGFTYNNLINLIIKENKKYINRIQQRDKIVSSNIIDINKFNKYMISKGININ
jgi:hypothetical protein